ncbi:MAG: hypothetical protein ACRENE_19875 [Polyangiaceae bacterium]
MAAVLALVGAAGCSNKGSGCDSSECAAGNQCIDDGNGGGATCHKVCVAQVDCPEGYSCNDGAGGKGLGPSWCVKQAIVYPPSDAGQFGTLGSGYATVPCAARKGEGANPDCDWDHGFACFGTSPTDAYSFCTQFACSSDSECPPTWWCATQNYGPNVTSVKATFGMTRTMCLPRTQCAPCKKDLDCYAPPGSTPVHCVPGTDGATFCATQCSDNSTCAIDQVCAPPWKVCAVAGDAGQECMHDDECPQTHGTYQHCVGGSCTPECASATDCPGGASCVNGTRVCIPRAGVCVGDGTFCSPCRSDDDCAPAAGSLGASEARGYCFTAPSDSTERFCTAPSSLASCDGGATDPAGCPTPTSADNWKVTACTGMMSGVPPSNQCYGLVTFASASASASYIPGCWTANR